jgi:hypothetical protein
VVAKVANRDLAHKGHCITRETCRRSCQEFSNGTFSLHGVDGSGGGANDKLALSILRPDGSTYHLSAGVPGLLSGGNLTIH